MSDTETFQPPGPVAARFFEAGAIAPFQLIMGPVGSAKSSTGLMRNVVMTYDLKPSGNGIRYAKAAIIRRLYKDLEKTTMQTWLRWFPKTVGKWRGGAGEPATHELSLEHPDGGLINLVAEFIALGDLRIEEVLRSWEGSWAFIDELDGLPPASLPFLYTRLGRYHRECCEHLRCIFAATNAPEGDNWVCEDFVDNPKPGHMLFRQPGGLTPEAENIANLPAGYYERLAENLPAYDKRRFVDNIPGLSRGTDPVYPEFDEDAHMSAAPLTLLPRQITLGIDGGGTPAAGTWQVAPNGQMRKLRELSTHEKTGGSITGPERFGESLAQQLHELIGPATRGMKEPPVIGFADPSASYGADTLNGESNWMEIVARKAGIRIFPARTNDPTPREEVYRHVMKQRIDGRTPALLIDPSCILTRRALTRDYRYGHILGQNARRTDKPLKNWASHLVEADQYALLDTGAYFAVMGRKDRSAAIMRPKSRPKPLNPFRAA